MPLPVHPLIDHRRAYRSIAADAIPSEVIDTLIQAAHLAPSCGNNQPWRFVVIDESEALSRVKGALSRGNYWAQPAPVIIAVTSERSLDCVIPGGRDTFLFSCGLAAGNLLLEATDRDLIAHPIAGFKQDAVKQALGIPEDYVVIALIVIGVPSQTLGGLSDKHRKEERAPRSRRPLGHVLARNSFPFSNSTDT